MMRRAIAVVAATLTAGLLAVSPAAHAADPPEASAIGSFVPRAQTILNTPQAAGGSRAEQYQLSTFVEKTLASMSPGSVARLATYSLTVPSTADAIIAAVHRGVLVRVIVDEGDTIQEKRLLAALGGNVKANRSYAIACHYSCNSEAVSAMHSKFFTFSSTGAAGRHTSEHVSIIGSPNLSDTNQYLNWNEARVLTDGRIYSGLARFFDQMRFDRNQPRAFSTFTSASGKDRVYMWPSGSTASDVFLAGLKTVRCKGTASGYGNAQHRTVVQVSMFYWVRSRYKVANQLVALKRAGCDVTVMYTNDPVHPGMSQELAQRMFAAAIPLYNTRHGHGSELLYAHSKMLLINGIVYGKNRALTYNGSANWTNNALVYGNEVDTRTDGLPTWRVFASRFAEIRKRSVRDARSPVTEPSLSVRSRLAKAHPEDEAPEDEDLGRV